jgi:hypothetical protein
MEGRGSRADCVSILVCHDKFTDSLRCQDTRGIVSITIKFLTQMLLPSFEAVFLCLRFTKHHPQHRKINRDLNAKTC